MEELGDRIRQQRQKHKLTLDQLSTRTGLSKSFLSQIERNLSQPSITSLKKIALQFGISVMNFFTDNRNNDQLWEYSRYFDDKTNDRRIYNKDVQVVLAGRRKGLTLPGSDVTYELLTPDLNRQLEVMYLRISKGDISGDEPMVDPPGEKCGIILKGTLEVTVADEVHQLHEGDSICYPSDVPHSWRGLEGNPIEVIWILTPPSF